MTIVPIKLGFTQQQGDDYIPIHDGFRAGAEQVTVTIGPLEILGLREVTVDDAADVAEACFTAMNAPAEVLSPLAAQIRELLTEAIAALGDDSGVHLLAVGDTVTVGDMTVACEVIGWVPL